MKSTILAITIVSLTCAASQAAVLFTGISQDNDGVETTTTLQSRSLGTRNSTQDLTGTAVSTGIPYADAAFSILLTGGAAIPISGSTSVTLQFTVTDEDVNFSNAQAAQFFDITGGFLPVVGASGVLTPGDYVMSSTASGSDTVADIQTFSLSFSTVPEPSTSLLALLGVVGLLRRRR